MTKDEASDFIPSENCQATLDKSTTARLRHGNHLFAKAATLGWDEASDEGPLEFIMRTCYQTGWDDRIARAEGGPSAEDLPSPHISEEGE